MALLEEKEKYILWAIKQIQYQKTPGFLSYLHLSQC